MKKEKNYFDDTNAHYCDFCAVKLENSYEKLSDGSEICPDCSKSRLYSEEEIEEILEHAKEMMKKYFEVNFDNSQISLKVIEPEELKEMEGEYLAYSSSYDPRSVALAVPQGRVLYVEKGAPRIVAAGFIVRELTNMWQYILWNSTEVVSIYGEENALMIYEGMAVWSEIQFLYYENEVDYAARRDMYYEKCFEDGSQNHYVLGF